ncbi:hypothetical protein KHP62_14840 [Rhodobacteraceae bacterium NNCM2]|nr:hypothetical protein [Coraliihabitans acroporae]
MKQIFLGPPIHWLILIVVIGLGWFAGDERLHVTSFNLFLITLIMGTVLVLFMVLYSARPGERITREPIEDTDQTESDT